ncbi:MAG TPA: 4,5-DOPA dioxygenase extradiol [Thermodesulfobacteriota bacterium]|nr:4,5-DOPA dioxygenase extradiol [Thermodesulfobacteriota bacterium]
MGSYRPALPARRRGASPSNSRMKLKSASRARNLSECSIVPVKYCPFPAKIQHSPDIFSTAALVTLDKRWRISPGDPALASHVQNLLKPISVHRDEQWGLDHGTWTALRHVFPQADVPVIQLSIDRTRPAAFHYDIGKRLAPLRDEGILIIGSGNLVHNLHAYAWGQRRVEPFDWAVRFEKKVRELLLAGEDGPLVEYVKLGDDAILSAPTPDHYLPLLYIIALRRKGDSISFPVEGIDGGSVSMLAVQIG